MACSADGVSPLEAAVTSCAMTGMYVGLLYLPFNAGPRDERRTIVRRLVTLSVYTALFESYIQWRIPELEAVTPRRVVALLTATCLTLLLYSGHLLATAGSVRTWRSLVTSVPVFVKALLTGGGSSRSSSTGMTGTVTSQQQQQTRTATAELYSEQRQEQEAAAVALRNYIAAPMLEELVFRRQTLLLWQCTRPSTRLLVPALLFALAHAHHARRLGAVALLFQLAYTFLFGVYAAALYVNTRTVWAPYAAHVVCNVLEIPDFAAIGAHRRWRVISAAYAACIALFAFGFGPATSRAGPFRDEVASL